MDCETSGAPPRKALFSWGSSKAPDLTPIEGTLDPNNLQIPQRYRTRVSPLAALARATYDSLEGRDNDRGSRERVARLV